MTEVYVLKYSKNKRDGIADYEILEIYKDPDFALDELDRIRAKNEGDGYTYYLDSHYLNETAVLKH